MSNSQSPTPTYWVVMPAAGIGSRMQAACPKQYLQLHGQPVIHHALRPFLANTLIQGIVVALADNDTQWQPPANADKIHTVVGGAERADSVRAALAYLADFALPDDWILVHDAARPCLQDTDLQQLITTLNTHAVGGLLAAPVADTLKRANATQQVQITVPRAHLWRALTPQMFRYQTLCTALTEAHNNGVPVTDESMAVEAAGLTPQLVLGRSDNLKITRPEDLALAATILARK